MLQARQTKSAGMRSRLASRLRSAPDDRRGLRTPLRVECSLLALAGYR